MPTIVQTTAAVSFCIGALVFGITTGVLVDDYPNITRLEIFIYAVFCFTCSTLFCTAIALIYYFTCRRATHLEINRINNDAHVHAPLDFF
jgi:hypothetical protein